MNRLFGTGLVLAVLLSLQLTLASDSLLSLNLRSKTRSGDIFADGVNIRSPSVFAFGDVHGDLKAFLDCLKIAKVLGPDCTVKHVFDEDLENCKWQQGRNNIVVVFTGDLLDRGPWSVSILKLAKQLQEDAKNVENSALILLKGNHEQMVLTDILSEQSKQDEWTRLDEDEKIVWKQYLNSLPAMFRLEHGGGHYSLFAHANPHDAHASPDAAAAVIKATGHGDNTIRKLADGLYPAGQFHQIKQRESCSIVQNNFATAHTKLKRIVFSHTRKCGPVHGGYCEMSSKKIYLYDLDVCMSSFFVAMDKGQGAHEYKGVGGFRNGIRILCSQLSVERPEPVNGDQPANDEQPAPLFDLGLQVTCQEQDAPRPASRDASVVFVGPDFAGQLQQAAENCHESALGLGNDGKLEAYSVQESQRPKCTKEVHTIAENYVKTLPKKERKLVRNTLELMGLLHPNTH